MLARGNQFKGSVASSLSTLASSCGVTASPASTVHGDDGAVRVELAVTTWSLDVLADGPGIMATGGGALVDELVVRL